MSDETFVQSKIRTQSYVLYGGTLRRRRGKPARYVAEHRRERKISRTVDIVAEKSLACRGGARSKRGVLSVQKSRADQRGRDTSRA